MWQILFSKHGQNMFFLIIWSWYNSYREVLSLHLELCVNLWEVWWSATSKSENVVELLILSSSHSPSLPLSLLHSLSLFLPPFLSSFLPLSLSLFAYMGLGIQPPSSEGAQEMHKRSSRKHTCGYSSWSWQPASMPNTQECCQQDSSPSHHLMATTQGTPHKPPSWAQPSPGTSVLKSIRDLSLFYATKIGAVCYIAIDKWYKLYY